MIIFCRRLALLAILIAMPAQARLPDPVRVMLDTAIASGNETDIASIAKLARQTNPDDVAEIDDAVGAHRTKVAAAEEERRRARGPFGGWTGSGELGGFITTGNTESVGFSAGVSLNKEGVQWRHKLRVTGDYQRTYGVTTRDQLVASYEPNFKFGPHLYAFGLAMHERDRFQGFASRTTVSGGLGYRVIDEKSATLDLKGGPSWRYTDWLYEPNTSKIDGFAGADFTWRISPMLTLTDNAQLLWGSESSTYNNLTALTAKLSRALSGRLSYSWRHETNPPPGIGKDDTITRMTLVYGF